MSFAASKAEPVPVAPGRTVGVQLNYQLKSCSASPTASTSSARRLVVSYRLNDGLLRRQVLPLGRARLRLRRPEGVECLPRPHSHIGLVGSFTTSPGHGTMPGSDGDTCIRSPSGALDFRSRAFFDRSGILFRVQIRLPHYQGAGVYQPAGRSPRTLGPAEVTVTGGFGDHGSTAFRTTTGAVTVTRADKRTIEGRFQALLSGRRRLFSAYGTWRCTTRTA
jgi:hypothetical protein